MTNKDHISESLETIFLVKILKFFDADPGWKKLGSVIRDKHLGSASNDGHKRYGNVILGTVVFRMPYL
jgi:hypothetical protein